MKYYIVNQFFEVAGGNYGKNSGIQILTLEIEPILEQIEIIQNESIEIICKEKFDLKIDIQKDNYISIYNTPKK